MIDPHQLLNAYQTVRHDLLAERDASGHWVGRLSSSALSTATAASALAVVAGKVADESRRDAYRQLAFRAAQWLAGCQNDDGGWGDTDRSFSNLAATLLVRAALHLAGMADQFQAELHAGPTLPRRPGGPGRLAAALRQRPHLRRADSDQLRVGRLGALAPRAGVALRAGLPAPRDAAFPAAGSGQLCRAGPGGRRPGAFLPPRTLEPDSLALAALERGPQPQGAGANAAAQRRVSRSRAADQFRGDEPGLHGPRRSCRCPPGRRFSPLVGAQDGSWPIDADLAVWNTTLATSALAAATGDVGALGLRRLAVAVATPRGPSLHPVAAGRLGMERRRRRRARCRRHRRRPAGAEGALGLGRHCVPRPDRSGRRGGPFLGCSTSRMPTAAGPPSAAAGAHALRPQRLRPDRPRHPRLARLETGRTRPAAWTKPSSVD